METIDYEKLAISTALRWPKHKDNVIQAMVLSVGYESFAEMPHQMIWKGISDLVTDNQIVTIPRLCSYLGDNLEVVGGEYYLLALHDFSKQLKVQEPTDWEIYVKVVYTAGRLRELGKVVSRYAHMYEDFEKLVSQTDNPETLVFKMLDEIQVVIKDNLRTGYKPIGDAVDAALDKLAQIKAGKVDIIPVGMPALEWYGVPYSRSFIVLIGLRSMGKTSLAFNAFGLGKAIHLYENNLEGCVCINSLETPDNLITMRMACALKSIDSRPLRLGEFNETTEAKYIEALEYIRKLPIVYDDSPILTTESLSIRAIAQNIVQKRVLGITDYAELLKDENGGNEEQRVGNIFRNVRQIAWSVGSCELLLSQVNKEVLKTTSMIAGIDNARYTSWAANAADAALELVNYPELIESGFNPIPPDDCKKETAYLFLHKNKNGPKGKIPFRWENTYTRFVDASIKEVGRMFDYSKHLGIKGIDFEIEKNEFDY